MDCKHWSIKGRKDRPIKRKDTIYLGSDGDLVKVGYSGNLDWRINQHKNANPQFKLIKTFNGTIQEEKIIHRKLIDIVAVGREWYNISDLDYILRTIKDTLTGDQSTLFNV